MISSPSCRSRSRPGKTAAICHSPIPFYPIRTKRRKRMTEMPTPSEDRYAHLRNAREKAQAKRRRSWRQRSGPDPVPQEVTISSRDPLFNYKKPRLVAELRAAQAQRDQTEQHYSQLLQEQMQSGLTIARLEAQLAEYLAFMERFRASLQREEHGPQS